jgi:hypothetical protein
LRHGAAGFAERDVWNVGKREGHSGLMLAARITLFIGFVVDELCEIGGRAAKPGAAQSASRVLILGSERAALISLLSLSTISAGVFLGAPMLYQAFAS